MLPPGMEWRQISLGMIAMIASLVWQKNRRRVYTIILAFVGLYLTKRAAYRCRLLYLRRHRRSRRNQILGKLRIDEVVYNCMYLFFIKLLKTCSTLHYC